MITAVYLISILLILFVSGFGLTFLLLPAQLERFRLAVTPIVGLAALVVFTGYFNIMGLPTRKGAPMTLAVLALLDVIVFWKQRRRLSLRGTYYRPFLFSLFGTVACAWPMFDLGPGYMGFVNRDVLIYTATARHLQDFTYSNPPAYAPDHPIQYIVHDILLTERIGSQFFLSSVSSLMHLDPKPVYMPVIFALYFLAPLALFSLLTGFLGMSIRISSLATFLLAISSISGFGYIYQLLAQSQGVPLMILTIGLVIHCLRTGEWKCVALASLLAVATVSTYVEISPFALGTPFLTGAIYLFLRQIPFRRFLIVGVVFAGAALLFLTPTYGYRLVHWLLRQAGGAIGNATSAILFPYMLIESGPPALFGLVPVPYTSSFWAVGGFDALAVFLVLSVFCALVAVLGLWQQFKERQYTIIVAFVMWFGLTFQLFRTDSGFGLLKLTMYMQFLIVTLLSAGIFWLWDRGSAWKTIMKIFVGIVIALNLSALKTYGTASLGRVREAWVEWSGISETNSLEEVRAVANRLPSNARIVLGVVDLLPQNWLAYILRDQSIRMLENTSAFGAPGLLEERIPELVQQSEGGWIAAGRPGSELNTGKAAQGKGDLPLVSGKDDYFLVWNDARRPQDFASARKSCRNSVWHDELFCLVPADQLKDFLLPVSGNNRTFWYLDKYFGPRTAWYAVEQNQSIMHGHQPFRWMNNSGLLVVYAPSEHNMRLSMDLFSGYGDVIGAGHEHSDRHVSLYCDGRLVDQIHLRGWARYVSKPFPVQKQISLIEIRVSEDVKPMPRIPALWKPQIARDYRSLNVAISNVRLLSAADYAELNFPQSLHFDAASNWQASAGLVNGIYGDSWVSEEGEVWLHKPAGAHNFTLEGNLSLPPNLSPPANIEVLFDDQRMARQRVEKYGPFRVTVPLGPADQGDRIIRVRLRSDRCFVPSRQPTGDTRELSFQVVSAGFR